MSFKVAFQSLHELFPQVDLRILKAVAIEHSEDIDAAVEFILNDVFPSIGCQTEASSVLPKNKESEKSITNVSADSVCIPADDNSKADDGHSLELGRCSSNKVLFKNHEVISEASVCSSSSVEPGTIVYDMAGHVLDLTPCLSGDITPCDSSVIPYDRDDNVQLVSSEGPGKVSLVADPAQMPFGDGALLPDSTLAEMSVMVPVDDFSSNFAFQVNGQSPLSANGTSAVETEAAASKKEIKHSYGSDNHLSSSLVTALLSANGISADSVDSEAAASEKEIKCSYGSDNLQSSSLVTSRLSASGSSADSVETEASEKERKHSYGSDSQLSSSLESILSANGIRGDSAEAEAAATEKEIKHSYGSDSHLSSSLVTNAAILNEDGLKNDFPCAECVHVRDSSAAALDDRLVPCEKELLTNSTSEVEHVDQEVCAFDNGADLFPFEIDMVSVDVNDQSHSMATRSGHVVDTDYLEEFICDAKDNKKLLVSSMESLLSMMGEVQLKEESAKQAKEEASAAGLETLLRVEELKQILKHAKEANEMHAAEVYGEKSILATEARELQSRMLSLSEKKDKSIKIIEEIRQSLQERMAAAEKELQDAEQEKLGKEELARCVFKEQEAIMESIVNESKKLQQEADENHKLKQFLTDRGHIVDVLQGEIAVVCEDVLFLKHRVDNRLPLNKSISSSSSISSLASSLHKSGSSDKASLAPENGEKQDHDAPETPLEKSTDNNSNGSSPSVIAEDDWEIFEASGISA